MNVFPLNIKTYIQTGCLSCKSEINDINNRINAITTTNIYCHECGANNEYIINNNVIHGKLVERTKEKGIALLKYVDDPLFLPVTDRSVMVKTNVGNYIECYSVTEIPTYEEGGNPYILILNKLTDEVIEYIDIQSWGYINET